MPAHNLTTSVFCLERLEMYAKHKPFEVRVERPGNAAELGPQTNLRAKEYDNIVIEDIRPWKSSLSLERNGFFVLDIDVNMTPEEFEDKRAIEERYLPVVARTLCQRLGARRIQIHDYLVPSTCLSMALTAETSSRSAKATKHSHSPPVGQANTSRQLWSYI